MTRPFHRVSRRTFLALAASAGVGAAQAWPGERRLGRQGSRPRGAADDIRILAAIEGERDDVRAGIRLGEEDMRQDLRALGRTLRVEWATPEELPNLRQMFASARVDGYTAAIVAFDDPPDVNAWGRAGLPVLAATPIPGTVVWAPRLAPESGPEPPSPGAVAAAGAPPSSVEATPPPEPPPAEPLEPGPRIVRGRWLFRLRADSGRREWRPTLDRFGADTLNARFRRYTGRAMTGDAWCGWVAVKAIAEAALHARSLSPPDVADSLRVLRFDGHKSEPLYFDEQQRLVQPLYD